MFGRDRSATEDGEQVPFIAGLPPLPCAAQSSLLVRVASVGAVLLGAIRLACATVAPGSLSRSLQPGRVGKWSAANHTKRVHEKGDSWERRLRGEEEEGEEYK